MSKELEDAVRRTAESLTQDNFHTASAVVFKAADTLQRYRKALEWYGGEQPWPNEGPWGVDSTDFGNLARKALSND